MKRDTSYDYIRIIAMLSIVLCHFFQIQGATYISSWLNIGVQVFLVLSAKLLCKKRLDSKKEKTEFFKTRVLRIYIPVWIYLLCLVPMLYVVGKGSQISGLIMCFAGLSGFAKSGVLGLGHFWYITVLIICYLLVPVMYKIACFCDKVSGVKATLLQMVIPVAAVLMFFFTKYKNYGVNIALFCSAYFAFYKTRDNDNWYKGKTLILLPVTIVLVIIRIFADTTDIINNPYYDGVFTTAVKALVGLFLFFLMYGVFASIKQNRTNLLCFISDISYEVYIVHQFILLAVYEFVPFPKSTVVGKSAMLVCSMILIFINAGIVFGIKKFIEKRVFKQ